jgi:hypothetical protein
MKVGSQAVALRVQIGEGPACQELIIGELDAGNGVGRYFILYFFEYFRPKTINMKGHIMAFIDVSMR